MIKKVYVFNSDGETLLRRVYAQSLSDNTIQMAVRKSDDCNFIELEDTIVYRQYDAIYVCFMANGENEMYISALIAHFMKAADRLFGGIKESTLIYNFKDFHMLLDSMILNGKVIELDTTTMLNRCHSGKGP